MPKGANSAPAGTNAYETVRNRRVKISSLQGVALLQTITRLNLINSFLTQDSYSNGSQAFQWALIRAADFLIPKWLLKGEKGVINNFNSN